MSKGRTVFDTPPESFRVRPVKGSRYYFLVHVADTLPAMKAAKQLAACVSAEGKHRSNRGLVGILFFARNTLGAGLVTHEMAHAAFRYCERKRLTVDHWNRGTTASVNEERFCDYIEELTRQFWIRYYEGVA